MIVRLIVPLQSVPRPAYQSPDAMPARDVAITVKLALGTLCVGALKVNCIGDGPPAGETEPMFDRARAPLNCPPFALSPPFVLMSASTVVLPPGTILTVY